MPDLTYELVAPLVTAHEVDGSGVTVVFQCPVSGEQIQGRGRVQESGSSFGKEVKRTLWQNMRWSLSRAMYSVFGYGVGGAIGSTVVDAAGSMASAGGTKLKEADFKAAVLDAFRGVSNRFAWDETNQRFVSASVFKDLQTQFTVIIQSVPITQGWDRGVLARMLAEIASADGKLEEGERELFHSFLRDQSIDDLLERAPLAKADLEEVSESVRQVMWLLAAAMAVSDEDFAPAEEAKLAFFAEGFGMKAEDVARGLELAKEYVLDQAIEASYNDGKMDKAERQHVAQVAARLGVSEDRAARLDARCRKRKGIV